VANSQRAYSSPLKAQRIANFFFVAFQFTPIQQRKQALARTYCGRKVSQTSQSFEPHSRKVPQHSLHDANTLNQPRHLRCADWKWAERVKRSKHRNRTFSDQNNCYQSRNERTCIKWRCKQELRNDWEQVTIDKQSPRTHEHSHSFTKTSRN